MINELQLPGGAFVHLVVAENSLTSTTASNANGVSQRIKDTELREENILETT